MKTGICLNMIIKNEAHILPRLFASLHTVIDYYVISDTGSTDNSIEIVKELGQKYKIEGIIESHPWVDFSHNRNIALEMFHEAYKNGLHQCSWWLVFDPDEELIIHNPNFINTLDSRYSYLIPKVYNNFKAAPLLLIARSQPDWHWKGAVHNYLENQSDNNETKVLEELSIKCHVFEGNKSKAFSNQREKSLRDIEILENELKNDIPSKTNLHRYLSIANEYHEAKEIEKAIEGFDIIVKNSHLANKSMLYFVFIQLGSIYFQFLNEQTKAIDYFKKAKEIDDNRKEAYFFEAKIHFLHKNYSAAKELLECATKKMSAYNAGLIFNDIYLWKIDFELLLINLQLQNWNEAKEGISNLKANHNLPKNRKAFLELLEKKYFTTS